MTEPDPDTDASRPRKTAEEIAEDVAASHALVADLYDFWVIVSPAPMRADGDESIED